MMPTYKINTINTNVNLSSTSDKNGGARATFRRANKDELDHQLFARNLKVWKQCFPDAGNLLGGVKQTDSYLLINDDGDFDICFRDKPLLGMGSKRWASQDFRNFHKTVRLVDLPYGAEGIETEVVDRMASRVESALGSPLPANPVDPWSYHVAILGFGLGDHVPLMTEITKCQNLILVEPNFEFIYLSLFTLDWQKFFATYLSNHRTMQIILDQKAADIELRIRDCIRPVSPHYIDGMTIINSYRDAELEATSDRVVKNAMLLNDGMGFLLDECDMLRNAHRNLQGYSGCYYRRRKGPLSLPAFVVGSGPSLDDSIDVIRENQGKAIIISCGTTLRILLANGIMPDFHVEMENTPEIADIIAVTAKKHDLSTIKLIASYTVVPGASQHFVDPVYYIRENLTASKLFSLGDDTSVGFSVPTVANLGFSFAQEIGCPDIYLFGVDLGARDIERHHAEGSAYHTNEAPYEDILDIPMRANFGGGDILTDGVFLWAKDSLEQATRRFSEPGRHYYNCSDGMWVDGFTTLAATDISLPEQTTKRDAIALINSSFPEYSSRDFDRAWNSKTRRVRLEQHKTRLLSMLNTTVEPPSPDISSSQPLNRQERRKLAKSVNREKAQKRSQSAVPASVNSGDRPAFNCDFMSNLSNEYDLTANAMTFEQLFFSRSLFFPLRALHYFAARTPAGEGREKIIEIGRQEIERHVQLIADQILELYDALDAGPDS